MDVVYERLKEKLRSKRYLQRIFHESRFVTAFAVPMEKDGKYWKCD